MASSEKRLRNQQELILVTAAREALDRQCTGEALMLIERISGFWSANLINIMSIICFSRDKKHANKARTLFTNHLELCESVGQLIDPALWAKNPKRSRISIMPELQRLIDARRKVLDPAWDGVWHNGGLGQSNRSLKLMRMKPSEIFDPADCLIVASQVRDPNRWLHRYRVLGGSEDDPKYLKIYIARVAANAQNLTPQIKRMLKLYCEVADIRSARAFIRHITPVSLGAEGSDPNWFLARYALLVYCSWERLEHDLSDWMHIAQSALYLDNKMIQILALRGLAGLQRSPGAQEIFERLIARNGSIRISDNAREDIGTRPNPIWQSIYYRIPVDANARSILITYSNAEESTL